MTKWRHLNQQQKLNALRDRNILHEADIEFLQKESSSTQELLNSFSENVISTLSLPFSIIPDIQINHTKYHVPFSIEETSVVAALSHSAKIIRQFGNISCHADLSIIQAQVFIPQDGHFDKQLFNENKLKLKEELNQTVAKNMVKRGGGVLDISLELEASHTIILIQMNTVDAHGANFACQVANMLRTLLISSQICSKGYGILTNVTPSLSHATITLNDLPEPLISAILDMDTFAKVSPLRAATHNKGILNGIDGLLMVTGNDWRANSAGLYHHAHLSGSHQPLSTWSSPKPGTLIGELKAPIQLGTTGGVTRAHPSCQLALKLLNNPTKNQLCALSAAIGLMQNFSAMRAIAENKLVKGHLSLHIQNRLIQEGIRLDSAHIETLQSTLDQKGYLSSEDFQTVSNKNNHSK